MKQHNEQHPGHSSKGASSGSGSGSGSGSTTPFNNDTNRIVGDDSRAVSPSPKQAPGEPEPEYSPASFAPLLKKLVLYPSTFTSVDVSLAFQHLAAEAGAAPAQIGAFLAALRFSGKDGNPLIVAECAKVMQSHAATVDVGEGLGEGPVCDIVGTGGDGQNTFNVSTTAAIVAAGVGCRVYKHGNKAATSSSGSADILLSLDCPVTLIPPSSLSEIASSSRFLFLYAATYHPSLVRLAPIRKSLAFPTVFNALGPLINPVKPKAMIVGVHSKCLGEIFVEVLRITGVKRAWVVCGREGLDEISIQGETDIWDLKDDTITARVIHPTRDFGLPCSPLSLVSGGSPSENASSLNSLLDDQLGPSNPIENFVVLNTAAVLIVAGKAKDGFEGVELARKSLKNGSAKKALNDFRDVAKKVVENSQ
ncbi:BZ3500_MvSof-1268-A1-R1_Chr3-3g06577 [Microbotryum saponariae]|uniref:Anthranilate phosphoribosyltransferase n=1 Tax=Microbotryum saponariae TaxID=289078 RepID=A0A2X0L012_9BASI|nr:BZ3500_MvSof-1268-A1-R1_Chr3-3g06577 [Microbotryum saponariae]SDA04544.1 BZ3501_MvSof-1269-A2-R1_Chr3-2g06264 [Microbotryum saponariae]